MRSRVSRPVVAFTVVLAIASVVVLPVADLRAQVAAWFVTQEPSSPQVR